MCSGSSGKDGFGVVILPIRFEIINQGGGLRVY